MKRIRFFLVGPGNAGISLAAAWVRAGHLCVGVEGGLPGAGARARRLLRVKPRPGRRKEETPPFDLLLLTVPDRRISLVARSWSARVSWRGKTALHVSGVIGVSALASLKLRGASVGSLHPLRSLPSPMPGPGTFRGITFGIQGDRRAVRIAAKLARDAGGKTIQVRRGQQALYHLGACLSSGYLLGLIDAAATRFGALAADPRRLRGALLALAESTLQNARRQGLERSLTGPIIRGDSPTVRAHLEAMKSMPSEWRRLHRTLALHTLDLALDAGLTTRASARRTRLLFRKR